MKSQKTLWEHEKPKVTLEFYICNFLIWERGWKFSSHSFSWSVNESRLLSSLYLVLWVVSGEVFCWFDLMLFISICRLFSYDVDDMDYFECTRVVNYFLLHAKFGVIVKLTIRCNLITRLFGAWVILNYFILLWVPYWK